MDSTIFISAGEASGEHYGALLVAALRQRLAAAGKTARFIGMGGQRMQEAGLELVVRSEDMAVMGMTEVLLHLPRIYGEFRKLKRSIKECRPDLAVLIDFPEIHFKLAAQLHRMGVPVIFFVSPQLWAWKKHRIELVRKYVDRMLVIFPFEEAFYREQGVKAEFVGHPLAELPQPTISREQFAAENGLHADRTWIGCCPAAGSRRFATTCRRCWRRPGICRCPCPRPLRLEKYEFVVPLAPTLNAEQRAEVLQLAEDRGGGLSVRVVDDARAALFHCRAPRWWPAARPRWRRR